MTDELLKVSDLSKRFGGIAALNSVTFTVKKNEIKGIIGPNGAGKTTLFNVITGIYAVSGGTIIYRGHTIHNHKPSMIAASGITRTFQNIRLFKKLTVFENIRTACHLKGTYTLCEALLFDWMPQCIQKKTRYGREERIIRDQAEELLHLMGLSDKRDLLAQNLSYGHQRRLEIGRALALNPTLLLLDEPAAGMNPDETDKLKILIQHLKQRFNLTILLIEHHMDVIMGLCDSIVVLDFGSLLAEGTPQQIQNNSLVQKAYLGAV